MHHLGESHQRGNHVVHWVSHGKKILLHILSLFLPSLSPETNEEKNQRRQKGYLCVHLCEFLFCMTSVNEVFKTDSD